MAPIRKGKIHPVYTLRAQLIGPTPGKPQAARSQARQQAGNHFRPAQRRYRAAGKRHPPMRHIRLRGLDRPPFCKLHAGFAESITWLEKGLLRIGHPFRPPGTSRVKMPFVLVYSPPIDGKCLHALSILVSPHICCRPDQCPYAVREGSFHPQRNIITHATRSSSTESRTFVFTAHLAVMVQRLRRFGVITQEQAERPAPNDRVNG